MRSEPSNSVRIADKHSLATRWFHWVNFPVLAVMVWSGLLIYWANDVYRLGWGSRTLFSFFPTAFYKAMATNNRLAEGMAWHFTLGWIFSLNGCLYVLYTAFSGEWRELLPRRGTLRDAIHVVLHDLRLRREPPPPGKFNGAQRIAYTMIIAMGLLSVLTGLAIYKPAQLGWLTSLLGGYSFARVIHFVLTLAYVGFFLVHIAQVVRAGWNNFRAMLTGKELVTEES